MPMKLFKRCCGPEEEMKWRIPKENFEALEAYSQLGIEEYYVIVWITEKEEYLSFMDKYALYME